MDEHGHVSARGTGATIGTAESLVFVRRKRTADTSGKAAKQHARILDRLTRDEEADRDGQRPAAPNRACRRQGQSSGTPPPQSQISPSKLQSHMEYRFHLHRTWTDDQWFNTTLNWKLAGHRSGLPGTHSPSLTQPIAQNGPERVADFLPVPYGQQRHPSEKHPVHKCAGPNLCSVTVMNIQRVGAMGIE